MVDSLDSGNRQAARFAVRVGCKAGRDAMPIPAGAASAASSSALVDDQNPAAGAAPAEDLATSGSRGSPPPAPCLRQIGRASCRERVCQYVSISVVDVSLKQIINSTQNQIYISKHKKSTTK